MARPVSSVAGVPGWAGALEQAGFGQAWLEQARLGQVAPEVVMSAFTLMDRVRRAQGDTLEAMGARPQESRYQILHQSPLWQVRDYGGARRGLSVLIIAAPIKRPYIWDLTPDTSVIRTLRAAGLRVFLLEWLPPRADDGGHGLGDYGGRFIEEAIGLIADRPGGTRPVLMGHSLGGTFAAIFAARYPSVSGGIVLLGAPLCFAPGTSSFRDVLTAMVPAQEKSVDRVPGSFLTFVSAMAAPQTFVWSRLLSAAAMGADPQARRLQALVERWCLDEFAMPGRLARDIYVDLYRDDRFCKGTLSAGKGTIGPRDLRDPVLAVVTEGDDIAPPAAMDRFLDHGRDMAAEVIRCPAEHGAGFAHLGILIGSEARAKIWPRIVAWMDGL